MTTKYTPEIVGVHYDILHYPFWSYEFKTLNLKQSKVTRKYMRGGFILEITNPRATFRDAAILLGVIKLYEYKIMTGDCRKNDIKDIDDNIIGYSYVITTTDRELCKFCGVSKGSSTTHVVRDAVEVLAEITAHLKNHDDRLTMWTEKTFHFIRSYQWSPIRGRGAHHVIEMDGLFLDSCRKENYIVNHKIIQSKKNLMIKGLIMFLAGRKSPFITLRALHEWFSIVKPKSPKVGCPQHVYQMWQIEMGVYNKQCNTFRENLHEALTTLHGKVKDGKKVPEKIVRAATFVRKDGKTSYILTKTKKGIEVEHIMCSLVPKYKYKNSVKAGDNDPENNIPF